MQIIRKYWLGFVGMILLLVSSGMIYQTLHPKELPSDLVEGSGRIDGELINLSSKYPGKIAKINVEDGMVIERGMIVAVLESKEHVAQKAQIEAEIEAQRKILSAQRIESEISHKRIPLAVKKAQAQLGQSQAGLEEVRKKLLIQERQLAQAKRDHERSEFLYRSKSIDPHTYELSKLKVDTEQERTEALKAELTRSEAAVEIAKISLQEAELSQQKLRSIEKKIEGFESTIKALEASRAQIDAILSELTLTSPVDGMVIEKIANEGEVVAAGMPVATLLDPQSLYLKLFVDTIQNGKIKVGDNAVIFLDAYPHRPIPAKVVNVARQAEFTPKEVSVRSDRIQRVFAVHLKPLKVEPLLKLGIPAIGVISTTGKALPSSLDEIPEL
jgi:HlyD family secretion protein